MQPQQIFNGGNKMPQKTETLTIKVSPEEKEKIKMLAAQKEWTVSKLLHKLLFESEENKNDNLPQLENDHN